uniref:RING-type domain-containing protein n=1 Tax=Glossina austeni TaxID=7395 RepID=A0A1A9VPG7_GLOAU
MSPVPQIAVGVILGLVVLGYHYLTSRQELTYIAHNSENPLNSRHPMCMICRSEVRNQVTREMSCGHIFHLGCLNGRGQCPTCRGIL